VIGVFRAIIAGIRRVLAVIDAGIFSASSWW